MGNGNRYFKKFREKLAIVVIHLHKSISMNLLMKGIANRHIATMTLKMPRNSKRRLEESIQDDPNVVPANT